MCSMSFPVSAFLMEPTRGNTVEFIMLSERDKQILGKGSPEKPDVEDNYVITLRKAMEQAQREQALSESEQVEEHPKLRQAEDILEMGIAAASGARKIIEKLFGSTASVTIAPTEKAVIKAVEKLFGPGHTSITFEMYKQATEELKQLREYVFNKVIEEQLR
jgi:hypothetical protein